MAKLKIMEAKDLRIGNYVRLNDCVCVVNSLHEYGIARLTPLDPSINWKWESFNLKQTPEANAILLTEQWLLKFGFDGIDFEKMLINQIKISFEFRHDKLSYQLGFTDNWLPCVEIQYVHQLQNLYFALTGNELQING